LGSMPRAPCHPLAGTDLHPVWGVLFPAVMSQFFDVFVRGTCNAEQPALLRPVYVTARALRIHYCLLFALFPPPSALGPCLSVPNDTEKASTKRCC